MPLLFLRMIEKAVSAGTVAATPYPTIEEGYAQYQNGLVAHHENIFLKVSR